MNPIRRFPLFLLCVCVACGEALADDELEVGSLTPLRAEELLRIGSLDDPELGFSLVRSVAVDDDGQVFVLEGQDRQVRVYDEGGQLLRRFGGPGEGPGEFQRPSWFGVIGDTVWVTDGGARRVTLFNRAGDLLETIQGNGFRVLAESAGGVPVTVMPYRLRDDGLLESTYTFAILASTRGQQDTIVVPRVLFDNTGTAVDTIGWDSIPMPILSTSDRVELGGLSMLPPRPFSGGVARYPLSHGSLAVDRTAVTSAQGAHFNVSLLDLNGDTIRHLRLRYEPVGYDEPVIDTIVMRRANTYANRGVDMAEIVRALRSAADFPPYQPPVHLVHVANDEGVWLRREDRGDALVEWLVLAPDLTPLGRVELPRNANIMWARGLVVWTVQPDEFNVPWLVKYEIGG